VAHARPGLVPAGLNRELRRLRRGDGGAERARRRAQAGAGVAPLWPKYGVNLGTLLRTCDAVGACMAVPKLPWAPEALAKGNTLRRPACVHWTGRDPVAVASR
jgi:tRNA (guanosine-2'-O-)-methyltransferase